MSAIGNSVAGGFADRARAKAVWILNETKTSLSGQAGAIALLFFTIWGCFGAALAFQIAGAYVLGKCVYTAWKERGLQENIDELQRANRNLQLQMNQMGAEQGRRNGEVGILVDAQNQNNRELVQTADQRRREMEELGRLNLELRGANTAYRTENGALLQRSGELNEINQRLRVANGGLIAERDQFQREAQSLREIREEVVRAHAHEIAALRNDLILARRENEQLFQRVRSAEERASLLGGRNLHLEQQRMIQPEIQVLSLPVEGERSSYIGGDIFPRNQQLQATFQRINSLFKIRGKR